MPQVVLTINGHRYPVACDDGQEDRIRQLGHYIDAKIAEFAKQGGHDGQVGEGRLLVMAGLVIADELAEATEALRRERSRAGNGGAAKDRDAATESVVAAGIESLAARIEAVAARLETTT
jgi:cell division protein ZapA